MCTANAEEAATATTAGAEHSVVERGAPDLNTTKRTASISDVRQTPAGPGRAGLGRPPWRSNVCCALSPHSRRGEGEAFPAGCRFALGDGASTLTRLDAVEPAACERPGRGPAASK